jgi:hypothetical protein
MRLKVSFGCIEVVGETGEIILKSGLAVPGVVAHDPHSHFTAVRE